MTAARISVNWPHDMTTGSTGTSLHLRIEDSVPAEDIAAAQRLADCDPYGYALNRGPVETKTPIYGIWQDKGLPECAIVLCRWFDGSYIFLRYPRTDLKVGEEALAWLRRWAPVSFRKA